MDTAYATSAGDFINAIEAKGLPRPFTIEQAQAQFQREAAANGVLNAYSVIVFPLGIARGIAALIESNSWERVDVQTEYVAQLTAALTESAQKTKTELLKSFDNLAQERQNSLEGLMMHGEEEEK